MMKMRNMILMFLLILSSAAFVGGGDAQNAGNSTWVVSGTDIYYSPNPERITVSSVSYSAENGGVSSTCGNYVQNLCNGKTSCTYTGSDSTCGVTSTPGQKNYLFVSYTCGGISYSKQIEAGVAAKIACPGDGNVGVGTEVPQAKLDVRGEVRFGNSSSDCNKTNEAQQRYNSSSQLMEFCDGKSWTAYLTDASLKTLKSQVDTLKTQVDSLSKTVNFLKGLAPPCVTTGMLRVYGIQDYPQGIPLVLCN
jgi:hypothetical protein